MDEQHIHNEKPVPGQNIAHTQNITQIFNGPQEKAPSPPSKPQRVWNIPYLRNDYFKGEKSAATLLFRSRRNIIFFLIILIIVGILTFANQIHTFYSSSELTRLGSLAVAPPQGAKIACGAYRDNWIGTTWENAHDGGYNGMGYNGSVYSVCNASYSYIQIPSGAQATFFLEDRIPPSKHSVDVWVYIPPPYAQTATDYYILFADALHSGLATQVWSICQSNYEYWHQLGTTHIPQEAIYLTMQASPANHRTPCKGMNNSKNSSGTFAEDAAALYFH